MRYSGLGVLCALAWAVAAAPASAGDNHYRDKHYGSDSDHYQFAHDDRRHYRDRKYRKHRKYRRHHRNRRHHRRHRHYDFHFYYGPGYRYDYRRDYRRHYRPRRYLRRHCHNLHNHHHGDYYKWPAGAVIDTELIYHAADHREPGYTSTDCSGQQTVNGGHEAHYRAYHNRKYSSL